MKILLLADEECSSLWDYYRPGKLDGYDLIISCGDLSASYLSFLVTMAKCPVLYVHGNHDTGYAVKPPEGCDCIDDGLVEFNGYRIMGLGGCRRYHPGPNQYSEREMSRRIHSLYWKLLRSHGVDIVVTHAAPRGYGDAEDVAHWGFECFLKLLDKYHPPFWVHGHVHMHYGANIPRERSYHGTRIINCCERYELELPDRPVSTRYANQLIWKTRAPKFDD